MTRRLRQLALDNLQIRTVIRILEAEQKRVIPLKEKWEIDEAYRYIKRDIRMKALREQAESTEEG